jgi:MinD superfamily P-loop ATPase
LVDSDVDCPNDHLLLRIERRLKQKVLQRIPVWNKDKCILCGRCSKVCNYNAIASVKDQVIIFDELCHSCGACSFLCPSGALIEEDVEIGKIRISKGDFYFADGILDIGQALAPAIIGRIKNLIPSDDSIISILDSSLFMIEISEVIFS